jgi:hypothetical protein
MVPQYPHPPLPPLPQVLAPHHFLEWYPASCSHSLLLLDLIPLVAAAADAMSAPHCHSKPAAITYSHLHAPWTENGGLLELVFLVKVHSEVATTFEFVTRMTFVLWLWVSFMHFTVMELNRGHQPLSHILLNICNYIYRYLYVYTTDCLNFLLSVVMSTNDTFFFWPLWTTGLLVTFGFHVISLYAILFLLEWYIYFICFFSP